MKRVAWKGVPRGEGTGNRKGGPGGSPEDSGSAGSREPL